MNAEDKAKVVRQAHEDAYHRIACQKLDALKDDYHKKVQDGSISLNDLKKLEAEIAKASEDVIVSRDCIALRNHCDQYGSKEKLLAHHQLHAAVCADNNSLPDNKAKSEKAIAHVRDLAAIWDADKAMDERVAKLKE